MAITLYHVTPLSNLAAIEKEGLLPKLGKRGIYAGAHVPAIYFFEDEATAQDGIFNWLADEIREEWAVLLAVDVDPQRIEDDPEIAGSFFSLHAILPENIRIVERVELGPDEYEEED